MLNIRALEDVLVHVGETLLENADGLHTPLTMHAVADHDVSPWESPIQADVLVRVAERLLDGRDRHASRSMARKELALGEINRL